MKRSFSWSGTFGGILLVLVVSVAPAVVYTTEDKCLYSTTEVLELSNDQDGEEIKDEEINEEMEEFKRSLKVSLTIIFGHKQEGDTKATRKEWKKLADADAYGENWEAVQRHGIVVSFTTAFSALKFLQMCGAAFSVEIPWYNKSLVPDIVKAIAMDLPSVIAIDYHLWFWICAGGLTYSVTFPGHWEYVFKKIVELKFWFQGSKLYSTFFDPKKTPKQGSKGSAAVAELQLSILQSVQIPLTRMFCGSFVGCTRHIDGWEMDEDPDTKCFGWLHGAYMLVSTAGLVFICWISIQVAKKYHLLLDIQGETREVKWPATPEYGLYSSALKVSTTLVATAIGRLQHVSLARFSVFSMCVTSLAV